MRTISVQLWSLRNETQKNFVTTLEKLAKIGFKAVEPAGFGEFSAKEFKSLCDDLGLAIPSSHSPWAMAGDVHEVMQQAHDLGLNKVAIGYGPDDFANLDAIKRIVEKTHNLLDVLTPNGFEIFQHNHAFEFERIDGKLKYDYYLEQVPAVKLELDTYWAANFGEEDPVAMIERYKDRLILAHIKDGSLKRDVAHVAVGEGCMDIPSVVAALPSSVDTLVIELDACDTDIFEAVEKSHNYLKQLIS